MELICDEANFTGTTNFQSSDIICKGSGNGEFTTWNGGTVDYEVFSLQISDLCPGVSYKYRVRERSTIYNNWSAWSSVGNFTVPGATPSFEVTLTASPELICAPDCTTLNATTGDGCSPPSLTWNQGLSGINEHVVCPTQNTTYQVTATFTVPYCPNQVETASVNVIADSPAIAGAVTAVPPTLCLGESTTLTIAGHYGALLWQSSENENGPFVDIPGATGTSYTFTGTSTGNFFFRVRVTTCTEEFAEAVLVVVYDTPQVDFEFDDGCVGDDILFENLTQNEFPIASWSWDFGNGTNSTEESPSVNFAPGTYQVTLTATNEGGCSDQMTQTVNILALPIVSFDVANVCEGETSVFNSSTSVTAPGSITSFEWDFGSDGSVDHNTENVSVILPNSGDLSVTLTVTSNDGCTASYTSIATVHPTPVMTLNVGEQFCTYDPLVQITDISPNPIGSGAGTITGPGIDGNTFNPALAGPGTHTITYTYTSEFGCSNTITDGVVVHSVPVVNFTANPLVGLEPLDVDFMNNSTGATNYSWNFGDGNTSSNSSSEVSHTFLEFGTYVVTLSAEENGCINQMTVTIQVNINPITYDIPNVFTPNTGDNINSFFQLINPMGFHRIDEFELLILNRWGNVLRTYENFDFGWDGKDESGNDVPEGVYFYKLNMRSMVGELFENHGFFHLIRE
jgi:gliding motility-associated-like protein